MKCASECYEQVSYKLAVGKLDRSKTTDIIEEISNYYQRTILLLRNTEVFYKVRVFYCQSAMYVCSRIH